MKNSPENYGRKICGFLSSKTLKIMKLTLFLSMLTISQIWASETYSQSAKLTLRLEDVKIADALKEMENQSDFFFLYSPKLIDVERRVTIDAKDEPIKNILDNLFAEKVKFAVYDRQVILTPIEQTNAVSPVQQVSVSGIITDEKGKPLPGVTILLKGTNIGTSSDINGKYTIQVDGISVPMLVFSYIGYLSQEISTNGPGTVDVILLQDLISIDEVVVIGYGVQKRTNITGSINQISSDNLQGATEANLSNLIQGKAAGVFVTGRSGRPGENASIRIRGKGSINSSVDPLWVVDGVIMDDVPILNPNEVEELTVLKDASATALYGSRGANGVILVTTKSTKAGQNTIEFSAKTGVAEVTRGKLKMMDSKQLYDYWGSFLNQSALPKYYTPDLLKTNTDWLNLASKKGIAQDYSLSMKNSNDKINSYFILGYYKETGAIKTFDFDRYSGRLNLDYKPSKWLKISPKLAGSYTSTWDQEAILGQINKNLPWDAAYDSLGRPVNPKDPSVVWNGRDRENWLYDQQWNYSSKKIYNFIGNLDFKVNITPNLSFESTNNLTFNQKQDMIYKDPRSNAGLTDNGSISNASENRLSRFTNQLLRYNNTFGEHNFSALLAYEYNDFVFESMSALGNGMIPGQTILDVTAKPKSVGGAKREYAVQSVLSNFNYAYSDRYLLQLSVRRDGSSKFGANNQYGTFGTVSGGWNIANESFFNITAVNRLKLTASYGSIGNTPNDWYGSQGLYSSGSQYNGNPGVFPTQLANPDLTWEKAYEYNFGIDTRVFDRIDVLVDVYNKNTSDLLYKVPLSPVTGYNYFWANVGSVNNKGLEATVTVEVVKADAFQWDLSVNMGKNMNKVTSLKDDEPIVTAEYGIIAVGSDVDTWYMKKWLGVNSADGKPLWAYKNKNGKDTITSNINLAQFQKVGKSSPDLFGGFSSDMKFMGFNLILNFDYVKGIAVYNEARETFDSDGGYPTFNQMVMPDNWNRWEKEGDIATHPAAVYNGNSSSSRTSSRFIEDGSYLRLQNVRLSYTIPVKVLKKLGLKQAGIYYSGDNLLTFTNFSGVDPATGDGIVRDQFYALSKKNMFGINISF
jgi:TonB-linked SusC/RagA family outer membrane protein